MTPELAAAISVSLSTGKSIAEVIAEAAKRAIHEYRKGARKP